MPARELSFWCGIYLAIDLPALFFAGETINHCFRNEYGPPSKAVRLRRLAVLGDGLVKVTKEKLAENRAALIQAAGRLFRERGIDGVGVAEISKAAGLTHGALYGQFQSKDALAAEALAQGFKHSYARMVAVKDPSGPSLTGYLDFLVSTSHRDDLAEGCPLTASTSEIARQGEAVGARFAEGFQQMADAIEAVLGEHRSGADRRQRALAIIAAEIGAIAVARATAKSHPRLSKEVLTGVRRVLGEVGGEARSRRGKRRSAGRRGWRNPAGRSRSVDVR